MRLVDGIRIFVAELGDDFLDAVVVACCECFANQALELEGAALTLIVELVVEGFGDVWVHG